MTGEIFSEDETSLDDVLNEKYLMILRWLKYPSLRRKGVIIDKRVIMESPREMIYEAHFNALDLELSLTLKNRDFYWLKKRLNAHRKVLTSDPNLRER